MARTRNLAVDASHRSLAQEARTTAATHGQYPNFAVLEVTLGSGRLEQLRPRPAFLNGDCSRLVGTEGKDLVALVTSRG